MDTCQSKKSPRQVVDDAYAGFRDGKDWDRFLQDFDDQSVMIEADSMPYAGRFVGRKRIRACIDNVFQFWHETKFDVVEIVSGPQFVSVFGHFRGTVRSSGKEVECTLVEIWEVRDGKVASLYPIYGDTKAIFDASL